MGHIPKNPVIGSVFKICNNGDFFDGATYKVCEHIVGEIGWVRCKIVEVKPWTHAELGMGFRWKWGTFSEGETLTLLACPGWDLGKLAAGEDEHAGMIYNEYTEEWVWF